MRHTTSPAIKVFVTVISAAMALGSAACSRKEGLGRDAKSKTSDINYASDYDIPVGDTDTVLDIWRIEKCRKNNITYLAVSYSGKKLSDPLDYISYTVYDSAKEAKKEYNRRYKECKEYDRNFEEGENWYISEVPGVCDAQIDAIECIEDNVRIYAEIRIHGTWAQDIDEDPGETTRPAKPVFDRSTLREYVLNNSKELKEYVLETILPRERYAWVLGTDNGNKYASEYDLKTGKTKHDVGGKWDVTKTKKDGRTYLTAVNPGADDTSPLNEQITYEVYDSRHDAICVFEELEKYYDKEAVNTISGDSYIFVELPDKDSDDGDTVTWLFRCEENVILSGQCWKTHYEPGEKRGKSYYNNRKLTDYIKDDAAEARTYVLEKVLGY